MDNIEAPGQQATPAWPGWGDGGWNETAAAVVSGGGPNAATMPAEGSTSLLEVAQVSERLGPSGGVLLDDPVWGDGAASMPFARPEGPADGAGHPPRRGTVEICETDVSPFEVDSADATDLNACEDGSTRILGPTAPTPDHAGARGEVGESSWLTAGADVATDFIPGVSNVKDGITAVTGVNPVTGERVGVGERVLAGLFAFPGVGNLLKPLARPLRAVGGVLDRLGGRVKRVLGFGDDVRPASVKSPNGAASGPPGTTKAGTLDPAARGVAAKGRLNPESLAFQKKLASESQTAELLNGRGQVIAGAGAKKPIDDIERLKAQYGGSSEDWAKIRSSNFRAADGSSFETHGYTNIRTGEVVELKTKFQ